MKLSIKAFALTCGIIWALSVFCLTWWLIWRDGANPNFTMLLTRIYIGYKITPIGSAIGLGWAFVDGLIGGAVFAWLYNKIAR